MVETRGVRENGRFICYPKEASEDFFVACAITARCERSESVTAAKFLPPIHTWPSEWLFLPLSPWLAMKENSDENCHFGGVHHLSDSPPSSFLQNGWRIVLVIFYVRGPSLLVRLSLAQIIHLKAESA